MRCSKKAQASVLHEESTSLRAGVSRDVAAEMKNPRLKQRLEDMAEVWERLARERQKGIVENEPNKG